MTHKPNVEHTQNVLITNFCLYGHYRHSQRLLILRHSIDQSLERMVRRHSLQQAMISKHLILAVDDDDDSLLLITQTLARADRSLLVATNGQTALTLAQTLQPHLILLDILLPDVNGVDVLHHLRQQTATVAIPVIAVTALARADDRHQLLQAGFDDCVSKPYLLEDLEQVVDRCLYASSLSCA